MNLYRSLYTIYEENEDMSGEISKGESNGNQPNTEATRVNEKFCYTSFNVPSTIMSDCTTPNTKKKPSKKIIFERYPIKMISKKDSYLRNFYQEVIIFKKQLHYLKKSHAARIAGLEEEARQSFSHLTIEELLDSRKLKLLHEGKEWLKRRKEIRERERIAASSLQIVNRYMKCHQLEKKIYEKPLEAETEKRNEKIGKMKAWLKEAESFLKYIQEDCIISEDAPSVLPPFSQEEKYDNANLEILHLDNKVLLNQDPDILSSGCSSTDELISEMLTQNAISSAISSEIENNYDSNEFASGAPKKNDNLE